MSKRKLRRQLNLMQVIMLGTAGTIAAEIFVLTGHAAGIAGPQTVLAMIIGGVLTLSIALNYCELATTYPVTGGAMTYVRKGFGDNLIMFLVGSLDGLSSIFYAALSAVGFAYSLRVFLPFIPIIPTSLIIIAVIGFLHIQGVSQAGNLQVFLGGGLLLVFIIFSVLGLTRETGFSWETFRSGAVLFKNESIWADIGRMLTTIALIYNAYVGFEVIADDAEEVINPNRNLSRGILISLGITTLIYTLVSFVVIGVIPYTELAGSETALTDAAGVFWPKVGIPVMAFTGLIATLTSINTAMLSATREFFSLGRERIWPIQFTRLSQWRTPYVSIIFVLLVSCIIAVIGLVDFLSFISSAGYVFVLFWGSLALIRLRKMYPNIERPFKVPLFPLTAYIAAGSAVLIIAFADPKALLFLGILLLALTIIYFVMKYFKNRSMLRMKIEQQLGGGKILVAAIDPNTAVELVSLATRMAEPQEDTSVCILSVGKIPTTLSKKSNEELLAKAQKFQKRILNLTAPIAQKRNVPIYTKYKLEPNVETAIEKEIKSPTPVRMVLLGWPDQIRKVRVPNNIIKQVMMNSTVDVGVLRDRGLNGLKRILVPVGTGPNSRIALRIANILAENKAIEVVALRLMPENIDEEIQQDYMLHLQEIIEEELGEIPSYFKPRTMTSNDIVDGILDVANGDHFDLMIIGASENVFSPKYVFGALNDILIENVKCSMLIVREYQSDPALWIRQTIKNIEE
jgi:basic amino acid/polyamine antiporter, APA family